MLLLQSNCRSFGFAKMLLEYHFEGIATDAKVASATKVAFVDLGGSAAGRPSYRNSRTTVAKSQKILV